ncbi:hypothetical protein LEL_01955 [Akanthomyces lecanii RCEF 1005]|uniref:Uncharacterized protein n=1 Tax=Akanthomyces lecanii RCEF 1005 TaxID=1081108 RepID=A0A168KXI1_CORDF|nr:hypothetical protein LEL_01955 [Akanthomyces lecanii RCEF 1005]
MGKKTVVPDAWDDDWEAQADQAAKEEAENPTPAPVLTKSERLAVHAESNRKLWESAESNETFHYVEAASTVPLAAAFKPQVKVLSRKPVIAKRGGPLRAMGQLSLDDDDDDAKKEVQLSPEEVRARQKREREEKQRKYDEARAKIFGESAPSSRGSSPGIGTTTPPRPDPRAQQQQQGRGRGRGGGRGADNARGPFESRRAAVAAAPQASAGKLFDHNYAPKPDSGAPKRDETAGGAAVGNTRLQNRDEGAPIRAPRGPDGTGRGGFGFARRGAKEA